MIRKLQKHALVVSILLLATLLLTLLFYPEISQTLSTALLTFGIGTAIIFAIQSNRETKQNDELTNTQFARNITIDLLGLAITMGAAMWLGRMAGGYAGETWGMIVGIVAGIAVGFGAALVVGKVWGKVGDRLRVSA